MTIFLDTDVLAYQYDDSEPEKQARARSVFLEYAADAAISTQVLVELHAVLTRKLGHSRQTAAHVLDALDLEVIPATAELVRQAAALATAHQLSIFDAMIVEAAAKGGCTELLTEDLTAGSTLRGVTVANPFGPERS